MSHEFEPNIVKLRCSRGVGGEAENRQVREDKQKERNALFVFPERTSLAFLFQQRVPRIQFRIITRAISKPEARAFCHVRIAEYTFVAKIGLNEDRAIGNAFNSRNVHIISSAIELKQLVRFAHHTPRKGLSQVNERK